MQETLKRRSGAPAIGRGDRRHRCQECGEPIRGIESTGPAGHRFVGCGHRADGRFVRPPATAGSTLLGVRHE